MFHHDPICWCISGYSIAVIIKVTSSLKVPDLRMRRIFIVCSPPFVVTKFLTNFGRVIFTRQFRCSRHFLNSGVMDVAITSTWRKLSYESKFFSSDVCVSYFHSQCLSSDILRSRTHVKSISKPLWCDRDRTMETISELQSTGSEQSKMLIDGITHSIVAFCCRCCMEL